MSTDTASTTSQLPEILGPRLTVYHLMPYFLDPTVTEAYICRVHQLTPEQVAAARAYVFENAATVLDQHMKIEERIAAGNPPEVAEKANKIRALLQRFQKWLAEQREQEKEWQREEGSASGLPSFREWLKQHPEEPRDNPLEGL